MPTPTLFIFTAVAMEANAVAVALGMRHPMPGKPATGQVGACAVSIHIVGIGAKGLGKGTGAAVPSCVVMAGLAGALDPALSIGDIIVDELPEGVVAPSGWGRGRIFTQDRIASTPAEKAKLFAETGALAVEMENAMVREWAKRHGAAFVAIRAISDRADQQIDPAVLRLVDGWGRPRVLSVLRTLCGRPLLISHLLRLGGDSKKASRRLGEAVSEFVKAYAACAVSK